MGKRTRKDTDTTGVATNGVRKADRSLSVNDSAVDPNLAQLFASSAGPVKAPPKSRYQEPAPPAKQDIVEETEDHSEDDGDEEQDEDDDEELSSVDGDLENADLTDGEVDLGEEQAADIVLGASLPKPDRKRKRKNEDEDLEGKYMQKLAREEEKEEQERQAEKRLKRRKVTSKEEIDGSAGSEEVNDEDEVSDNEVIEGSSDAPAISGGMPGDVPMHESLAPSKDTLELDKASRTVFLANVCTSAISSKSAKKTLLAHMGSFLSDLPAPPAGKPPIHKVDSIRFRSTAYAGTALPKKAAFAKKELMSATTKSTNAYVVYSTAYAAREAVKRLNGTVVLERHLRVDGVAHPSKIDHRRCIFVGNLGFVDDESLLDQGGENERKRSKVPSDVEEGLWRQFNKAGIVESVRVVRDEKTRVGKGFAYVQFLDPNSVEAALLFNEKKYPPMLPRVLRVVRAKAVRKTALASSAARADFKTSKRGSKDRVYNPKVSAEASSLKGRASKLLGKAGAAQLKSKEASGANGTMIGKRGATGATAASSAVSTVAKTPESFVFEGYRASSKSGKPKDLKFGSKGGGKKGGKPKTRSSKRASEWKNGGSKK